MQEYNPTSKYIPSRGNVVAGALSRVVSGVTTFPTLNELCFKVVRLVTLTWVP